MTGPRHELPVLQPRYPVYVISKGRAFRPLTAKFLKRDGVPFKMVVEQSEYADYVKSVGAEYVLPLPEDFRERSKQDPRAGVVQGGGIPARNFVWEHALASGAKRHWILDDNIRDMIRLYKGQRIVCRAGPAFNAVESFVDRFTNVGVAGMNYKMFGFPRHPVFFLNVHVYSSILIRNDLPFRWRGRYNEDTDLCLQALANGWCTILTNIFLADKLPTLQMKGGNMDALYKGGEEAALGGGFKVGDGKTSNDSRFSSRLEMAKALERAWPGVVSVTRRFGRPQHMVDWRKFTTELEPTAEWAARYAAKPTGLLAEINEPQAGIEITDDEFGLELRPRVPVETLDKEISAFYEANRRK